MTFGGKFPWVVGDQKPCYDDWKMGRWRDDRDEKRKLFGGEFSKRNNKQPNINMGNKFNRYFPKREIHLTKETWKKQTKTHVLYTTVLWDTTTHQTERLTFEI